MEDEAIIADTDLEQTTGPRGADDISVEIMSLSHQNWRLRAGDRRDGAGRMGAEWVWRAWGPHRPALPRTFPRHHVDPGQSEGLPGEKGSMDCYGVVQSAVDVLSREAVLPLFKNL